MDEDLKRYADSLYENTRNESARESRADIQEFLTIQSYRGIDSYGRQMEVAINGVDMRRLLNIFDRHIERCMVGRLESYQRAFEESGRSPSEQELTDIWSDTQTVKLQEIRQSVKTLRDFINSRGGAPYIPDEAAVAQNFGQGYERVFQQWKIWKTKAQLKAAPPKYDHRERQLDKLTELFNRAEFDDDLVSLSSTPDEKSPLSLLFMDLDKFKSINDGPGGHEAGDRALRALADSIRSVCKGKGMTYRYGGDEMCVLLPNHSLAEALVVAERVCLSVSAIRSDDLPNGLSTSIGVATFPETTADSGRLCSQADRAMYVSKNAGGNRVSKADPEPRAASSPGVALTPNPADWT